MRNRGLNLDVMDPASDVLTLDQVTEEMVHKNVAKQTCKA